MSAELLTTHGEDSVMMPEKGFICQDSLIIEHSGPLRGEIELEGAKNATLVIMASLLLTSGISKLRRVPPSADVFQMKHILELLGAIISFDERLRIMIVDTRMLSGESPLNADVMSTFRASTLVLGPLLARFSKAIIAFPGGDAIGKRPIDFHIRAFERMGAIITVKDDHIIAIVPDHLSSTTIVLEYPSVGTTENSLMAAALTSGKTTLVNAALEPEIFDLVSVLEKMGAHIEYEIPGIIHITGCKVAAPVEHAMMFDRLEAGTYLIAAAITKGSISIPQAPVRHMIVFLEALRSMGHVVHTPAGGGLFFMASENPRAISFRTMPHPGFPTDLQAPMVVAQIVAQGSSSVHETVYDARLGYVRELQRLGAQIVLQSDVFAMIQGGATLHGAPVVAGDIRSAAALTLAGLVAHGQTELFGVEHIRRGYVDFVHKLNNLGAAIQVVNVVKQSYREAFSAV